jgi:DNA repair photolyase
MTDGVRGRGAAFDPPTRFERFVFEREDEAPSPDDDGPAAPRTQYFVDRSKSILAENDSPDVPFRFSANPYRGCEHGCIYCYARPSHEYLGFSAGLDFETKIMIKPEAPALLRREIAKRGWSGEMICLSGNTDCYQPVERSLKLTRGCLEALRDARNAVGVITKNALVARDADVLGALAKDGLAHVTLSITTLDADLARRLEPRASVPSRRLDAIAALTAAGVPVGVNVSPVIPGLTDDELPAILEAARNRGAVDAGWTLVRLPGAVQPLFLDWLRREAPTKAEKVLARLRDLRGGALSDARFGARMHGGGPYAALIGDLFDGACRRLGLNAHRRRAALAGAERPKPKARIDDARIDVQGELFG